MSELAELLGESMDSLCRVLIAWEDVGRRRATGLGPDEAWEDFDHLILEHREIERRIEAIVKTRP